MCTVHSIETTHKEAFADRLLTMLNESAVALMISVGHRLGLFDTMKDMPAATSMEIAGAAGLNERYVREWLGAMTAGKIIDVFPSEDGPRYRLPGEHAAFLTRDAGADNFGVFTQYLSLMGSIEEELLDCFRNGGGIPYEKYRRFHDVMAEDSGHSVLTSLFESILPLDPGIQSRLDKGIDVLDVGCGQGKALIMMALRYPNSTFTGYDLCEEPIMKANTRVKELGLSNIRFAQKDLTGFDVKETFDFITAFDAIHDQARPDTVLKGIHDRLRPGGTFLMQDISGSSDVANNIGHPLGAFLYTVSTTHCMTVSLAQGGMGLGTMWGRELAQDMLKEAGFTEIEIQDLEHDPQNCYYVMRKES